MIKMSKFVEQLANYVSFEVNVRTKRKEDLEKRLNEKSSEEAGKAHDGHIDRFNIASDLYSHTGVVRKR